MAESSKPRRLRVPALPRVPAALAAGVVGAVMGLVAVGLVSAGEQGCDAVRGRPTCGGYGLVMIIAIAAAVLLLGSVLLKLAQVENGSLISFFGVMLALVILLAVLIDEVFSPWMLLILPALAGFCFAAAALLTRALENSGDAGNLDDAAHDVPAVDDAGDTAILPRYAPDDEAHDGTERP